MATGRAQSDGDRMLSFKFQMSFDYIRNSEASVLFGYGENDTVKQHSFDALVDSDQSLRAGDYTPAWQGRMSLLLPQPMVQSKRIITGQQQPVVCVT
eukprot:SAG31_NODE_41_length_31342_cov_8.029286_12_plen_97_part_00